MAPTARACIVLLLLLASVPAPAAPSARRYFNRGIKAFKAGDHSKARAQFAEARELAPEWAMPHLYWAISEITLEPDSDAGLAALQRALDLAPDNPRINYFMGITLERRQRWSEAASAFERALELRPGIRDACFHLGLALESTTRPEAAIEAYRRALDEDPNHIGALAALASLYERFERLAEAEAALRRIARLQPEVAYHRYRLAQFYERIGEADKARRARHRAEDIEPQTDRKMRPLKPSRK